MQITESTPVVLMSIAERQGYSAQQVTNTMTLRDLREALEEAIDRYGEDAVIVTDNGDRYGARFGGVDSHSDLFTREDGDESYCEITMGDHAWDGDTCNACGLERA